ncbi:MAG: phage tail tape measure protein [Polyangiaceae bacterium]|nr:phage tail tape measure protein [Polyangiaceae bacterium]
MREGAIGAGLATEFSPDQAVEAMTALSSAGLNARDAMATLNTALNVATASAGKLTTDQSATLVAQTMKSWGLSANQASPAMDKIAKMANAFSASIEDMPLLLANSQRGVAAMGSSVTDTMVSLGLVRNLMPRVESAATAVGVAMESMADPKVQQKLKGLGVTVADTSGKFRAFPTSSRGHGPRAREDDPGGARCVPRGDVRSGRDAGPQRDVHAAHERRGDGRRAPPQGRRGHLVSARGDRRLEGGPAEVLGRSRRRLRWRARQAQGADDDARSGGWRPARRSFRAGRERDLAGRETRWRAGSSRCRSSRRTAWARWPQC